LARLEKIEREIEALARDELARFPRWFAEYDAAKWNTQIKADAHSGSLDALGKKALAIHRAGRTRPL